MLEIKNNFSRILGELLISKRQVHEATGISRSTLNQFYYRRNKMVSYSTLTKLCDYLQIDLSELLEYKPEKRNSDD